MLYNEILDLLVGRIESDGTKCAANLVDVDGAVLVLVEQRERLRRLYRDTHSRLLPVSVPRYLVSGGCLENVAFIAFLCTTVNWHTCLI